MGDTPTPGFPGGTERSVTYGTEDADETERLTFWSIHTHEGSGLEIRTKHFGVCLYHNPTQ
jgi:hypothetical protein